MSFATMMESFGTLYRATIGQDSSGGTTQDPFVPIPPQLAVMVQNIPCSISQAGVRVQELYAQRNVIVNTRIAFDRNPRAEVNDIFKATDRSGIQRTYLVRGVHQPLGRAVAWTLDCEVIQEPGSQ
jgi:hypothetical protein